MSQRVGINWAAISRFAALVVVGMLVWGWWPALTCVFNRADDVQIGGYETEDDLQIDQADLGQVDSAQTFMSSLFGSAGRCFDANPVASDSIPRQGALGGFGLYLFALAMGRLARRRQIRDSAKKNREARRRLEHRPPDRDPTKRRSSEPIDRLERPARRRPRRRDEGFGPDDDPFV